MKSISKRVSVICISILLLACMAVGTASPAFAAKQYYSTYSDIAAIKDKGSCSSMQGFAVGSTYIYSTKINSSDNSAFISKTNRKTGSTVTLKTSSGSQYFNYLGHANDMELVALENKHNLFITTMKTGSKSLIRMTVDGSKITKKGNYTLKYNGEKVYASGVVITSKTASKITFLFKRGTTFYTGTLKATATSGTINLKKAFTINTTSCKVNGATKNLSKFTHQGFGYHKNYIFVPLFSNTNSGQSVVLVYNIKNASGSIKSDANLSFRITSSAYGALFEIEGCDISGGDGKLYFNTNRRKSSSSTNWDGIHVFKGYTFK